MTIGKRKRERDIRANGDIESVSTDGEAGYVNGTQDVFFAGRIEQVNAF